MTKKKYIKKLKINGESLYKKNIINENNFDDWLFLSHFKIKEILKKIDNMN